MIEVKKDETWNPEVEWTAADEQALNDLRKRRQDAMAAWSRPLNELAQDMVREFNMRPNTNDFAEFMMAHAAQIRIVLKPYETLT